MSNQHQASARIKTRFTSHQVEASPLRHPEAYLNIDEHDLPGVIRAGEAILAHDFSKDMYSAFTQHAHVGNGVVAGFSRFESPEFIVISFPGINLHYSADEFREALALLKEKEAELRKQRAQVAQPVSETGGASVVGMDAPR